MTVIILNGNPSLNDQQFDEYLKTLSSVLIAKGHSCSIVTLRGCSIHNCIGCYSCWLKTPGVCIYHDDMPPLLRNYLNADVAIFASPLIMGFVSALLKKFQERLMPLIHPYLQIYGDRVQHMARYSAYPSCIVLLGNVAEDNIEDVEIVNDIFQSGKTKNFLFTRTMNTDCEELANEIDHM